VLAYDCRIVAQCSGLVAGFRGVRMPMHTCHLINISYTVRRKAHTVLQLAPRLNGISTSPLVPNLPAAMAENEAPKWKGDMAASRPDPHVARLAEGPLRAFVAIAADALRQRTAHRQQLLQHLPTARCASLHHRDRMHARQSDCGPRSATSCAPERGSGY